MAATRLPRISIDLNIFLCGSVETPNVAVDDLHWSVGLAGTPSFHRTGAFGVVPNALAFLEEDYA